MKTMIRSILLLLTLAFTHSNMYAQLTSTDKQFLDQLFQDFLFKPRQQQQRVKIKVLARDAWGHSQMVEREGWWLASEAKVYFVDGDWVKVPSEDSLQKIDYVQFCRDKHLKKKRQSTGQRMNLQALGLLYDATLVDAAWLYALKEEKLAKQILDKTEAKNLNKALESLRAHLAWNAYAQMVHAYMVRADDEAWKHGQRFSKLYEDQFQNYPQAKALLEDMKRRKLDNKLVL